MSAPRRLAIPSRPQPSQQAGGCLGCDRYTVDGAPWVMPHEVYVIDCGGLQLRLCRLCLVDLSHQWLTSRQ